MKSQVPVSTRACFSTSSPLRAPPRHGMLGRRKPLRSSSSSRSSRSRYLAFLACFLCGFVPFRVSRSGNTFLPRWGKALPSRRKPLLDLPQRCAQSLSAFRAPGATRLSPSGNPHGFRNAHRIFLSTESWSMEQGRTSFPPWNPWVKAHPSLRN